MQCIEQSGFMMQVVDRIIKSRKVFGKMRVLAITIKTLADASRAQQCAASGACGMHTAWLWGSLTMKP